MRRRKFLLVAAIGCLVSVAAAAILLFYRPVVEMLLAKKFDPSAWQVGSQIERGRMARDLVSSRMLLGRSREQVVGILGDPNERSSASMSYTVDIGHRFGLHPWTYRLCIEFKDDGTVETVYLHD